jgi:hypothetical protein
LIPEGGALNKENQNLFSTSLFFLRIKLYESKLSTPLITKKTETVVSVFFVGDEI